MNERPDYWTDGTTGQLTDVARERSSNSGRLASAKNTTGPRREVAGRCGMQLAGGSEKSLLTEAVCEFIIFSNLPASRHRWAAREGFPLVVRHVTTLAQFGQNPLERR